MRSLADWLEQQQKSHPSAIDLDLTRVRSVAQRLGLLPPPFRSIIVAGTNHLLVPARTGEEDEYGVLESRTISPEFGRAIAQWLKDTLAGK